MNLDPRRIARLAILIALSAVGALIKIPSPVGTVAFDSAPAFLAAIAFTGYEGMIVAAVGHLLSALTMGMPLGVVVHLVIAVTMALAVGITGWLARRVNLWVGVVVGLAANAVLSPLALVPMFGWGFLAAMVVPLLVGAALNIAVAVVVARSLVAAGLAPRPVGVQ